MRKGGGTIASTWHSAPPGYRYDQGGADGPDEVHLRSIARAELSREKSTRAVT